MFRLEPSCERTSRLSDRCLRLDQPRSAILFAASITLAAIGLSCKHAATTQPPQAPAAGEPSNEPAGTLLRIVCDIPAELDKPLRTCPANIGWSYGNVVRGQTFSLPLAKREVEVQLQEIIPIGAEVHIRFEVKDKALFATKFKKGEWFCGAQVRDEASTIVLTVGLSRCRWHDEHWVKTVAP